MTTKRKEELKKILQDFFNEKKVKPPITGIKLEKQGYDKTAFLLELRERLSSFADEPIMEDYFKACERLL